MPEDAIFLLRGVGPTFTAEFDPKTGTMKTMWRGLYAPDATCPHGVSLAHDCAECAIPRGG